MFRLTQYLKELRAPTQLAPHRAPPGPVVIWNLVRRCNLLCKHCYSISGNVDFPDELSTAQALEVMADLKAFRVPVLILSGGEPLLRHDIFGLSQAAIDMGFYVGLSTNGTLIDDLIADRIAEMGYDYVGISLDGIGATHDRFRGQEGAYDSALRALRMLRDRGVKVGVRFTMTADNEAELPRLLDLVEQEGFHKFYLSHLVYAGRGNKNRGSDADWAMTRRAMMFLIERAGAALDTARDLEIVTGNNDADAAFLLMWAQARYPDQVAHLRAKLQQWGGNASGVSIANIDNLGHVHPDTMWWHHSLGNVKDRPFSQIWMDTSDPIMAGLKARPRVIGGRCGACSFFDICGGNTRVRALKISGDAWAEDPGCYLSDAEIGVAATDRLKVVPFRGARHEQTAPARPEVDQGAGQ